MARILTPGEIGSPDGRAWLERAKEVRRKAAKMPVFHHARASGAGAARVSELAGIISLDKPAPSKKFLRR